MAAEMFWIDSRNAPVREPAPGLRVHDLWRGDGRLAQLVEIAPGARYPGIDRHEPGPEECFVVSGVFNDGVRDYSAGSFIHCPAGSEHVPQSTTGCVLFLFYPEG
jgi:quercetin dioxygenase-like cupin family protein